MIFPAGPAMNRRRFQPKQKAVAYRPERPIQATRLLGQQNQFACDLLALSFRLTLTTPERLKISPYICIEPEML
jgi:hypothetical protein